MTGNEYAQLIARYIVANFGERGVKVYREVDLGKTIIGKNRRIDVFIVDENANRAFALECKYQGSQGTVDEKIPYTLQDLESLQVGGAVIYAGEGFSPGVLHLLQGSGHAAYCLPEPDLKPTRDTRELYHFLAMHFNWWDVVTANKQAVEV